MTSIDIVKIICKSLNKPESLITYVANRKATICAMPSFGHDPTPNDSKPFSGLLIIKKNMKRLYQENIKLLSKDV